MSRFAAITLEWFWRPWDKSEHFVRETEFANVLLAWVGSGARRSGLRRRSFFDRADRDLFLWPCANAFNGEMGYGESRPAPENGRRVFVLVGMTRPRQQSGMRWPVTNRGGRPAAAYLSGCIDGRRGSKRGSKTEYVVSCRFPVFRCY
jgi:hypothetical protein